MNPVRRTAISGGPTCSWTRADQRITGVLDWELAAIADPARDFGGLGYLGVDFMTDVLSEYERLIGP